MKLQTRYNYTTVAAAMAVLLFSSLAYYFLMQHVLVNQLDQSLKVEQQEVLDFVSKNNHLPDSTNYDKLKIDFSPSNTPLKSHFDNIVIYNPGEVENEPFRRLQFTTKANNQLYLVSIAKSKVETEDLLSLILMVTLPIIILSLLMLLVVNRLTIGRLWKPFFETLTTLKGFNLNSNQSIKTSPTNIDEFTALNHAVEEMTNKVVQDYGMLKNFTDNASHEMQTPLAIIRSKLDLLIQEAGLNEAHLDKLQGIDVAVNRLSKLSRHLLLLTRIENNQFIEQDEVDLAALIREKVLQLEEIINGKQLKVALQLADTKVLMNDILADTLLNNLIGNAISHNVEGGEILIVLEKDKLEIVNTGLPLPFDEEELFQRFSKDQGSTGTGLGLAIVKQICDSYRFGIQHFYEGNRHHFLIRF